VSLQGVLLIDLLGVAFAMWILNLVRTQRLHLGYALLWLTAVAGMMLLVTVAPLRDLITRAVGAVFPASAIALLAFAFIFFVLILFSVQVSALSRRQSQVAKELARRTMRDGEPADD
jgi:hypothetical protein